MFMYLIQQQQIACSPTPIRTDTTILWLNTPKCSHSLGVSIHQLKTNYSVLSLSIYLEGVNTISPIKYTAFIKTFTFAAAALWGPFAILST